MNDIKDVVEGSHGVAKAPRRWWTYRACTLTLIERGSKHIAGHNTAQLSLLNCCLFNERCPDQASATFQSLATSARELAPPPVIKAGTQQGGDLAANFYISFGKLRPYF